MLSPLLLTSSSTSEITQNNSQFSSQMGLKSPANAVVGLNDEVGLSQFRALLSELGELESKPAGETDFAALKEIFAAVNGEDLPQSSMILNPLEASREDLLAYLMVNAGLSAEHEVAGDGDALAQMSDFLKSAEGSQAALSPSTEPQWSLLAGAINKLAAHSAVSADETDAELSQPELSDIEGAVEYPEATELSAAGDEFQVTISESLALDAEAAAAPGEYPKSGSEVKLGLSETQTIDDPSATVAEEDVQNEDLIPSEVNPVAVGVSSKSVKDGLENGVAATRRMPEAINPDESEMPAIEDGDAEESEVKILTPDKTANRGTDVEGVLAKSANKIGAEATLTSARVEQHLNLTDGADAATDVDADAGEPFILQQQRAPLKATIDQQILQQTDIQRPVKLADVASPLTDRIFAMVKGEIKQAFIRLDPPELGALEVRVQVQNDQTHIQIVTQSPQVREALEAQSVRLREAMAEQGLNLANLDVSDQSSMSQQEQSERGSESDDSLLGNETPEDAVELVQMQPMGLVDHYV